ncbi:MAG TPA: hypothetical protein VIK91_12235 [Nannocystis sp.]
MPLIGCVLFRRRLLGVLARARVGVFRALVRRRLFVGFGSLGATLARWRLLRDGLALRRLLLRGLRIRRLNGAGRPLPFREAQEILGNL